MIACFKVTLTGPELAMITVARRSSPRTRRAFRDAIKRCADGQPLRADAIEAFIELGHSPELARRTVKEVLDGPRYDWRTALD
jgi:hypothetical protein